MKDMKQLINKWGESMLFSLLMALCLTWTFTACSDDKDNEYISDTQLSILEDNRTSLSYLLKNSTFGTAPGTFPEASKEILNNAIAELDQLITKVKGGEMFDEATFEATIAKVNQAIDEFKNSKYYNLSPEAQKFISDLMAKADELREMIANEALWGNHQGQYPVEGKATLESAAEDLESLADRIKTSAITDMTQEIYDDAIAAADKKLQEVENSAWPEDNLVWNLFVDGNKGGYIDFGYSEDFVKFGDDNNPLLVSVRSGARASMPGMMDTILNLGLNDVAVEGLAKLTGNPRFAYDSYRRFIQMFADVVMEIEKSNFEALMDEMKAAKGVKQDTDLDADDLKKLVQEFKAKYEELKGEPFPQDPKVQLLEAVKAVFRSWDNPRANVYRRLNGIPYSWGTAVNVQTMVFGNMGEDSGTGVAFSRNPATGENVLYGEYLFNAQGEDVVAGIRTLNLLLTYKKTTLHYMMNSRK